MTRRPALAALAVRMLLPVAPASVQDRPVEFTFLPRRRDWALSTVPLAASGHVGHAEVFQRDRVVGVDERPGGLVVEVVAAGCGPGASAVASAGRSRRRLPEPSLARCLAPLQIGDPRPRLVEEPRVGNDLAIGSGQESGHAKVNTSRAADGGQRLGGLLGHHDHIPAAVIPFELQRFTRPLTARCWLTLLRPTAWKVACRPATVGRLPLGAVGGDEQDLVEPLVGLEPRIARVGRLLAARSRPPGGLHPLEERREGGVQPPQRLLLRGERMPPMAVGSSARISRSWADWSP